MIKFPRKHLGILVIFWLLILGWGASALLPISAVAAQPAAAPDGTLPWGMNFEQNMRGPTAAWTDMNAHVVNVCNGKWCWQFDLNAGLLHVDNPHGWMNGGAPSDLSSRFSTLQATNGLLPWSESGPTSAWEEYKNKYLSINLKSLMWLKSEASGGSWLNSRRAFNLPDQEFWRDTVAADDGTMLWSNKGITAAWTDKANEREYFCNGKWCWVFNYGEGRWHNQNNASKGRPFNITSLFKIAPAPNGSLIVSGNGPSVGWTDDLRSNSTICTDGWCWSYANRTGSQPDLLDENWDNRNAQGLGTAYNLCQAWGGSNCPNLPPPPAPEEPNNPPAPVRGDFNNDRAVNMADVLLMIPQLNSTNATYNLVAPATVDIYDFNELLKLLR